MKKLLLLAGLILLAGLPAGAQSLCSWRDTISNSIGQVIPNATVIILSGTVTGAAAVNTSAQPGTPLATIYQDPYGATLINQSTNPINTSTGDGTFQFWGTCGAYVVIQAYGPGISGQYVYGVQLGGAAGVGSGCVPAGVNGGLIYKSGSTCQSAVGITTSDGNSLAIKGPKPYADITAFTRDIGGPYPTASTSCVASNNQVTITAGPWLVGDGVTLYGCGGATGMGTPTSLSATPSEPWGLTGTESVVTSATGSSTYIYTVFARDVFGGLTAPISPVTITNGQASLGLQTCTINTLARSNDTVTLTTTSACPLVAGTLIDMAATSSPQFSGWYNVGLVNSTESFTLYGTSIDTRAQGWMVGDTTASSSGGTLGFYQANFLKWTASTGSPWEYYVCAKRPGDASLKLIGVTKPTGPISGVADVAFEDYGSPYEDNQTYPAYVTNSSCGGSATHDPLTTTITNINTAGTVLTLAAAPSNSTSTTMVFDNAPGILAAANSVAVNPGSFGSAIYIPPSIYGFYVNSYLQLPVGLTIWQAGELNLYETITSVGDLNWFGDWGSPGTSQFNVGSDSSIYIYASPGIYLQGSYNNFRKLSPYCVALNGCTDLVSDGGTPGTFDIMDFITGESSSSDYTGMAVVLRSLGSENDFHFDRASFQSGPGQVTDASWTPLFWIAPAQSFANVDILLTMQNVFWNRRGLAIGGGYSTSCSSDSVKIDWSYRQGGITPMIASMGCPAYQDISSNYVKQDTEGQPLVATFNSNPASGQLGPHIDARNPSGGAGAMLFQGLRPSYADLDSPILGHAYSFENRDISLKSGGGFSFVYAPYATTGTYKTILGSLYTLSQPTHIPGGYSLWFDTVAPSTISTSTGASGSVPAGTYVYCVSATGADGGETICGTPSTPVTNTSGTQTNTTTWVNPLGSYSSNVYRCPTSGNCTNADGTFNANGPWYRVGEHESGTSFADTQASPTQWNMPNVSGTGSTIVNKNGVYTALAQLIPLPFASLPSCAAGTQGTQQSVIDSTTSTWGGTISGGGSDQVLAYCDGSNWTVAGK